MSDAEALRHALSDRFGSPPPAAESLFEAARLRILATRAGVEKLTVANGWATFHPENRPYQLTPEFLATAGLKFLDPRTFKVPVPQEESERLETLGKVLIALEACARIPDQVEEGSETK